MFWWPWKMKKMALNWWHNIHVQVYHMSLINNASHPHIPTTPSCDLLTSTPEELCHPMVKRMALSFRKFKPKLLLIFPYKTWACFHCVVCGWPFLFYFCWLNASIILAQQKNHHHCIMRIVIDKNIEHNLSHAASGTTWHRISVINICPRKSMVSCIDITSPHWKQDKWRPAVLFSEY